MSELLVVGMFDDSFIVEEDTIDEVDDVEEGDEVVELRDLELNIELTIVLGTNHLSFKI